LEKTENWQSKDSILETFYNWGNSSRFLLDDEFKKRVGDYLEAAIEDENPSVRSSAVRLESIFMRFYKIFSGLTRSMERKIADY